MAELDPAIQANAAFQQQFTPTNAMQRIRRAEAIAAANDEESAQAATQFERQLQTDKGARDLFLGQERLRQAQQRIGMDERKMQQNQINFETTQDRLLDNQKFQQDLGTLKFRATQAKQLLDKENALRITGQTADATERMRSLYSGPVRRGSPEFAKSAMNILADNPDMDKGLRSALLADARFDEEDEATLDGFISQLPTEVGSRKAVLDRATFRMSPNGRMSVSIAPQKAATEEKPEALLERARNDYRDLLQDEKRLGENMAEEDKMFFDAEKRRLRKAMVAASAPDEQQPKTPPPDTSSKPAQVRQNGVVYSLQPDGTYK